MGAVSALRVAEDETAQLPEWVERAQKWSPVDLDTVVADVRFALHGLIPLGKVGALVAAGGTGKTTLLLVLFVCIATGRPFFGLRVKQGTAVLLSSDDPQEDLEGALIRVCAAMALSADERIFVSAKVRVVSLLGLGGTKVFTRTDRAEVIETGLDELILQAVAGAKDLVCIALDTLRQFSGGNSNDEQVIKLSIAAATTVAMRTGASVILPHHTGKQNYRDGVTDMYCGSGSAAIADNCRFVLLLQTTTWADIEGKVQRTGREYGQPLVLHSTRGSLLVKPAEPMFLHRDGFYLGRIEGAVKTRDQQEDERDRAVLHAVRAGHQFKNAIHRVVKGNKTACLARVDDLVDRGLLQIGSSSGSKRLMVSSAGATYLDAHL